MKTTFNIAIAVSLLALMSTTVTAQTVKNGEISGIIVSKSVSIPATSSANLYTTPATGFFIITQACSVSSNIPLSGSGIGEITRLNGCQTFTPGFVVPAGTTLSCYNEYGFTSGCTVTGVLSKK
jgi:hypothetical protein